MSNLLFICGFPSGGTDLIKSIINVHPGIYINGEMPLLYKIKQHGYDSSTVFYSLDDLRKFQNILSNYNVWGNIENLGFNFEELFEEKGRISLISALKIMFSQGEREIWGNKTPQNTENIDTLHHIFPEANFLIISRDVRDICLSWKRKWGKNMLSCAHKWSNRMKAGWEYTKKIPDEQICFIKYEDILQHKNQIIHKICDFMSMPVSEKMYEHHKYMTEIIDGKLNYGKEIKEDNMMKWKDGLTPRKVKRIEEIAYDTMQVFNYAIVYAKNQKLITQFEILVGDLHDALSMVFVGNRASQDNSILTRLKMIALDLKRRIV